MKPYHWLTFVFVTLKLLGIVHWSWWWVLAPFWIAVVLMSIMAIAKSHSEAELQRLRRRGAGL